MYAIQVNIATQDETAQGCNLRQKVYHCDIVVIIISCYELRQHDFEHEKLSSYHMI